MIVEDDKLCETLIQKILKYPNLKSEYCQASIIIIRNILDEMGYKTDRPKYILPEYISKEWRKSND